MKRYGLMSRLYAVTILAGGLGVVAFHAVQFFGSETPLPSPQSAALWLAMLSLAAAATIPLPRRSSWFSAAPLIELAALLVFGAPLACALALVSRVLANGRHWRFHSILAPGRSALAVAASGYAYSLLGGVSGEALASGAPHVPAMLLAGVILIVAHRIIGTIADTLRAPDFVRQRLHERLYRLAAEAPLTLFALPLALIEIRLGPGATLLFVVPLALAHLARRNWARATRSHLEAVRVLMSAVDAADPFTRGHCYRISKMSLRLGKHFGLDEQDLIELEYAALVHDIGRTAIQHDMFEKPRELNTLEQTVLRTHPKIGSEILQRIGMLPRAAEIVHAHHEQPDGKGYPQQLSGGSIPVASRIVMVVAAFDAMTSDRPYRRGLSPEAAFEELRSNAGTQFFEEVVEALHALYDDGSLFREFDSLVLAQYARGGGNSRAVEEYLKNTGQLAPKPTGAAAARDDDVPMLELPPVLRPDLVRREFVIAPNGARKLVAAGLTDPGCVRDNNEDSFGMFHGEYGSNSCLLVVADGMGGAAAGEVASKLSVETLRDAFFGDDGHKHAGETLRETMRLANEVVHARSVEEPDWQGMGTTCVAAVVVGGELTIGHVGDSRAYLVARDNIRRLTHDHSLAEELAVVGAEARKGAEHILTRSLGQEKPVDADISQTVRLATGHTIVLCTDGLSNVVESDEILQIVSEHAPDVACSKLVDLARERGAPDNVTVEVARVESK